MIIDYVDIRLAKHVYSTGVHELTVTVTANGQQHATRQMISENDLVSFFDYIWERGGKELKAHMLAAVDRSKEPNIFGAV